MREYNRRQFYRVPYPEDQRPRLVVGCSILEVLDCSEGGLRYAVGEGAPGSMGDPVEGRLRLRSGEELRVRGRVIRCSTADTSLRLEGRGIPFRTILREQIRLRAKQRTSA